MYDPEIGRWNRIDRFAEKYYGATPYQYVLNNPINAIDINGDTTKLIGWNNRIEEFNNRFYSGIHARINDPSLLLQDAGEVAGNILGTLADFSVNLFGENNPTRKAIAEGVSTLGSIPNMSDEELGALAASGVIFGIETAVQKRLPLAAKSGGRVFRYMTEAELRAIQKEGLLRGGRAGETFFTKDLYKSASKAQRRLALPNTPTLRVEFEILNNPTLLRTGTKVQPAFGMPGKGTEFMTIDPVRVRLINWQTLGK